MFVISAYRVHKQAILDGIARLGRTPDGSGDPLANLILLPAGRSAEETKAAAEIFLDHVIDNLEHRLRVLVDVDHAKLHEADKESLTREHQTWIAWQLRDQYMRQRNAFVSLYGEELARQVGFETVTEREPAGIMFQVRRAVEGLIDGRVDPGEPVAGIRVDPAPYGRALLPKLRELEAAVRQVDLDDHSTAGRLRLKNLATEKHDEVYGPAATLLVAAFQLAGLPELAEWVKPVERRRPGDRPLADAEDPDAPDFSLLGIEEPLLPGEPKGSSGEPGRVAAAEGDDPESGG